MEKNYTNKKFKRHYVEIHNTYKDIEYVICIWDGGWRTAYINLKDTPLAHLDVIPLEIDVHGGFTWVACRLPFESDCEEELFINNNSWYGWDYAHYGDGYDISEAKKVFPESNPIYPSFQGHIYTFKEVLIDVFDAIDDVKLYLESEK